jgi:hypothetical protein
MFAFVNLTIDIVLFQALKAVSPKNSPCFHSAYHIKLPQSDPDA